MQKIRIDILLTERGLVESRSKAQRLVMAGQVIVDDQVVFKPATKVPSDAQLHIEKGSPFVSRGGEKLEAAVKVFDIDISGKICADIGASTGGFTDCLLQHGAERVYAIDVGRGILHWQLRQDPRVAVMEGTNARYVEYLPEAVDLVTVDASFISLKILLPVVRGWFSPGGGDVIVLIKPQFEAGRAEVSRGEGVIRDPTIHRHVLMDVLKFSQDDGYQVLGLIRSPLLGPKGNTEFLSYLKFPLESEIDITKLINDLVPETEE
jgi:23S rRNA (cytidine1920-2'-O)/16S rRNA (cytidine1409-2'-O)-methyltransferase